MRKAKETFKGERHPQYGHIWITHPDLGTKKISKEELSKYTKEGWTKGRKIKN
jgi:hypothetical protein